MKKVILFLMTLVLIVTLTGCGTKPTATVSSEDLRRSSYSFNLKVDDKDIVTKGSVLVNFYKISKKEETLITTKTLATFDESVSVTGLESDTEYRCDCVCTYGKKSHIIYSWVITTKSAGTKYDPIIINTAEEFVNAINTDYSTDAYYELGADIDFAEYKPTDDQGNEIAFEGLATTSAKAFSGYINGANHKIKNVTITSSTTYNGLFGYLKGTLENIDFENISITATRDTSSTTYVGGVAGYSYHGVKLNVECKTQYVGGVTGYAFASNLDYVDVENLEITSKGSNTAYVGGLTSYLCQNSSSKYGKVIESTVSGKVNVSETKVLYYGGLVGFLKAGATINKAIANVDATLYTTGETCAAGLVGKANLSTAEDRNSINYVVAMGKITYKTYGKTAIAESSNPVIIGGLLGSATAVKVTNAYIDMALNEECKMGKDGELYTGLVFGRGYEFHTELHNAVINGSITAVTADSDAESKISIHGYDGSTYIDGLDEKPLSVIDSENVDYISISINIDGTESSYPENTASAALAKASFDTTVLDVEVDGSKLVVSFK